MIEQKTTAYLTLETDALRIEQLLRAQIDALCMSQCPIIEEVIDTQLFGFSREVDFAKRMQLISAPQGATLMRELEERVNQIGMQVGQGQAEYERNRN
ncbi:DUF1507 family protein [Latilactobacillus curvatus]|uniref:DUF1507 family protein n=1 Tax=Latilactobacillus curvatus TaxID=28038 RepID=UPI0028B648DE|nr:DUF1507 family protein [Latilactobacillus curvatus]MDT7016808.1 DUF1507 family protein [Latilactobacillus curvatus]